MQWFIPITVSFLFPVDKFNSYKGCLAGVKRWVAVGGRETGIEGDVLTDVPY